MSPGGERIVGLEGGNYFNGLKGLKSLDVFSLFYKLF